MTYKINDFAILKDSDGRSVLIAESVKFLPGGSVTATNTESVLSPTYISDYFFQFGGSTSGYTSSASAPSDPAATIDKFPFSADANATDVGDLTSTKKGGAGASSTTHGYVAGGYDWSSSSTTNAIEKFSFSVDGNATDVGDLTQARRDGGGVMSQTHGYMVTGATSSNVIDKYPFASNANATDVGNTTTSRSENNSGSQSLTHGYQAGGISSNVIDKFPFASDGNATDVGDLVDTNYGKCGQFSDTNGYATRSTAIEKYPYASDANAVSAATLAGPSHYRAGQSSTTHGYASGGTPGSSNEIDKFPFAVESEATDVGDLTQGRSQNAGNQV